MNAAEITARIEGLRWFHRIPLGEGVVTPGSDIESDEKLAFNQLPDDLTGKTVIDIGAWDGLFSFKAERRGAIGSPSPGLGGVPRHAAAFHAWR